jgi:SAM-dependent methyltransferase
VTDPSNDLLRHFETLHRDGEEPWLFSERGVETMRHARIADLVRSLVAAAPTAATPRRVLEIGCSLGLMTARLAQRLAGAAELHAVDLSPNAVRRTRARWRGPDAPSRDEPRFSAASGTELPFARHAFDVVVASDGLYSWHLPPEARTAVLREIHDALAPGGHAVLTEHMRPKRFPEYVAEVRASPLRVLRVSYMHDRPCYQFEGWLKAIQHTRVARALRRSEGLARALSVLGRPFGAAGSRHILVVATRDG